MYVVVGVSLEAGNRLIFARPFWGVRGSTLRNSGSSQESALDGKRGGKKKRGLGVS